MSWVVPIRPVALPAWKRLQDALTESQVPCRDRAEWMSDSAADREYAVAHCRGCPVLDTCTAYADAAGERGVWGGEDRTPRKKQPESIPMFDTETEETA